MSSRCTLIPVAFILLLPQLHAADAAEAFEIRAVRDTLSDQTELKLCEKKPMIVDKKSIVTTADVAKTSFANVGRGEPEWAVQVWLTETGGKAFDDFAEKNLKAKVAIMLSGQIMADPVLMAPHFGGFIAFSTRSEEEAKRIAAFIEQKARPKKSP